ncbi:radical SAM protein [Candidatus Nitrosopelagicus sp.]|nr:radical SAM protein [Candidatus Nitrosopelagicus sp.]
MMLNYDAPLYRPPSEANSLIFQVTLGCSFNECSFCDMYRSKEYSERTWEEVKGEIDMMEKIMPNTKRVFLADGDAINLSTEYMTKILKYIREKFSLIERISCYAMPMNLLKKTPEELQELREAGLDMLYLGIESGSDIVLKKVTKGATSKTIIKSCNKAKDAGFKLSCMVILGLGGKKYSKENAIETGKVISASKPDFVGALTLYLENGIKDEFMTKWEGEFVRINDSESLEELELLVSNINTENKIIFRANHGSNAYNIAGTFPEDKQEMLAKISLLAKHPENARPQGLRSF